MWSDLPLFPERASTVAGKVDNLYFFLVAVTVFFSVLIFLMITFFAVRYRRRSALERPRRIEGSFPLEIFWTVIPFIITMVMFGWGATLYFRNARPPSGTMEIYVVAKQWMWKLQHPEGPREINGLHIPVGVPIRMVMTSEDVIHSFYVPVFRVKQDVLPGRYTTLWFQATKTGRYHLFCAEYCGNQHSGMIGWVDVLDPSEYESWLNAGRTGETMASAGQMLYERLGCGTCHAGEGSNRGPSLAGILGHRQLLENAQSVEIDEGYLRESILDPRAKIVAGYRPVMPTYQGQISEDQLTQLIVYIKTLKGPERTTTQ